MANTSKVIDLDRLARFKAKQDAANDAKFALKGEGGSIATADKAGIVKPGGDFDITEDGTISLYKAMGINSFTVSPSQAERGSTVATTVMEPVQDAEIAHPGRQGAGHGIQGHDTLRREPQSEQDVHAQGHRRAKRRRHPHRRRRFPRQAPLVGRRQPRRGGSDRPIINQATGDSATWYSKTFTPERGGRAAHLLRVPRVVGTPRLLLLGGSARLRVVEDVPDKNASGATISYVVWKSTNAGLGNTTVEVK